LLLGVRNAFYGVPMAEILHPHGLRRLVTAYFVIDETTAMAVGQRNRPAQRYAFWTTALILCSLWQIGSLIGAVAGAAINPADLGLDAAAPTAFLALLWPALKSAEARLVALGGAVLALALVPVAPAGVPVIASAVVAIVAGLRPRPSPSTAQPATEVDDGGGA
jgi:predicted branched-subunit amino acid permease